MSQLIPSDSLHFTILFPEQVEASQMPHPKAPSPTEQQEESPDEVAISRQVEGHTIALTE